MKKIFLVLAILVLVLVGCSSEQVNDDRLTVAVTIIPEASFVEAIAGDLLTVVTLIPPGASPTNYQPTPKEMAAFSKADLYFTIGVGAEEAHILPNITTHNEEVQIIDLASVVDEVYPARYFEDNDHALAEEEDHHEEDDHDEEDNHDEEDKHDEEHDHEGRDPHIWMSPKRVIVMAHTIKDELQKLDPANAEIYAANTKVFVEKLEALDASLALSYASLSSKRFIVMHPSIGYMADDYNLEMISIEEEGKEASVSHLQKVVDYAREQDIHVVFYQQEFDSTQAETIAEEIDGEVQAYEPLSADYFGSMKALAEAFGKATTK